MTLHFDRLTIRNFGPYKGSQTLELTPGPGSPLTLIHGENTLGKTQLFSALRWCFYGSFQPQQKPEEVARDLPSRMNNLARSEGERDMEVSIGFTANGETYHLTRRASFERMQPKVTTDLRIGATVIPPAQIDAEVGRLLHPQISEFFLFDAELMKRFYERLSTDRERALIQASIESVLGVPALQLARRDIGTLAAAAYDAQARTSKHRENGESYRTRLKDLANEQRSLDRDKEDLRGQIGRIESTLQSKKENLKQVASLQADIREQELLEARLSDCSKQEAALRAAMKEILAVGWLSVAADALSGKLRRVQEQNTKAQQQEQAITDARRRVAVLEDRSRGGDCPTCGQRLPEPDASTAHELTGAKQALDALLLLTGGPLNLSLERLLGGLVDRTSMFRYKEKHAMLNEAQMTQYEIRSLLRSISDRLAGNDAAKIRALAGEVRRLDNALVEAEKAFGLIEKRLKALVTDQQKLASALSRLPNANPAIALEAGFYSYMGVLLDGTIDQYRERVRDDVESLASKMFLNLIRDPEGYKGIQISPSYEMKLLYKNGKAGETSEGGKQLLALALIGALKHAAVRGGPVVIDSPLGRLDLKHRANVLQSWVPALGTQAILLVQSGELTEDAAHELVGPMIGHEYRIVRPDNNPEHAVIERVGA